jgi:hypothetical protein
MVDPPADGEPTRRKRTRKPTDEVARLRIQLADEYVKHTEEVVALHERIAELEAGIAWIGTMFARVEKRTLKTDDVILHDDEVALLRAQIATLSKKSAAVLSRMRKKVSEKKPWRKLVVDEEKFAREIYNPAIQQTGLGRRIFAWLVDKNAELKKMGEPTIRIPKDPQTIARWIAKLRRLPK